MSSRRFVELALVLVPFSSACVVLADDDGDDTGSTGTIDPTMPTSMTTLSTDSSSTDVDPTIDPTTLDTSSSGSADESTTTPGTTTGGADPIEYAGEMNGYRWELPCEAPTQRDTCPWDPALLEGAIADPMYTLRRETAI